MTELEQKIFEILNRDHNVANWPDDEADAYRTARDAHSIDAGFKAVDEVRAKKIIKLVLDQTFLKV